MKRDALNNYYHDDEIDLYDLWLVLKKRRFSIILVIMVSLGISFVYVTLSPKVYRVTNTLILNNVHEGEFIKNSEIIAAVADLDDLLTFQKAKTAYLLGIQVKDLNSIKKVKASDVKGSSALRVEIETTSIKTGIVLMTAIPDYIQSTPNIARQLSVQKTLMEMNMKDLKAIIDNPMRDLKLAPNTVVYVPSIDLYSLRERYNHLNILMEKMKKGQILALARKTEPPRKQFKPKRLISIIIGFSMGCFFGAAGAFFMEWISYARKARGLE